MNPPDSKAILEFALLAAGEPLDMSDFRRLLGEDHGEIESALKSIEEEWSERGFRLARAADGWQLISREGYLEYLRRLKPKKPARLSRQLMEVLAVIAYRQPATRGDIEQVRGVTVSSVQLAALEEFGWIEEVGRRETPGRPILYATTNTFLHDLAISSLGELPQLEPEDINAGFEDSEETNGAEADAQQSDSQQLDSWQSPEDNSDLENSQHSPEAKRDSSSDSPGDSEEDAESESEPDSGSSPSERDS